MDERILFQDVPIPEAEAAVDTHRTRTDLASRLLTRVERLPALLGTVPLATEVRLLKRDLARGHPVLRAVGEDNFLSVLVLVEAILAGLTWKLYTPEVVDALREAFAAGTREEAFTLGDYDAISRRLMERGFTSVPTINLDALEPEALEDGQMG